MKHLSRRGSLALPLGLAMLCMLASCHDGLSPFARSADDHEFGFPEGARRSQVALAPPLSLTASDGTGLRLVELKARAVVDEPLALTELTLTFDNPEDRTLEGNFTIVLPDGASLSRFAMKIGDAWQEGEVVEKQRAREVYEDYLHRKQDPALLEQAAGNAFSARVFPIPARGRKELVLSYSQEIAAEAPYVLPLRGLPELGKLDISVSVAGFAGKIVQRVEQASIVPTSDFRLEAKYLRRTPGVRSGELVLLRAVPLPEAMPDPLGPTVVLVDTSASRALGFEDEVELVGRFVRRLAELAGPKTALSVACYDQTVAPIFDGEAGAFGDVEIRRIRDRQAFGASDLGRALAWAKDRAGARGARRAIVITDGVATAGATAPGDLGAAAARLKAGGVERLDVIAMGGIRDAAALRRLVTAGLARDGVVVDGARGMGAIERRLTQATRSGIAVKIEGATWQWPRRLDGVQPGDEALIYAEVPSDRAPKLSIDGAAAAPIAASPVERPLLERAWAKAKIASLLEQQEEGGPNADVEREVIALSTRHRVLSPYTSLLVLESDHEYARFGLDRTSLGDILTVDDGRIAVARRTSNLPRGTALAQGPAAPKRDANGARPPAPRPAVAARQPAPRASARPQDPAPWGRDDSLGHDPLNARGNMWGSEIGDSFGAGGLGLTGIGEGGGGRSEGIGIGRVGSIGHGAGSSATAAPIAPRPPPAPPAAPPSGQAQGFGAGQGRLGGAHRVKPPQVRMGATQVSGRLPPEIIQRTVRLNFGQLRRCYEDGLRNNPNLRGRVSVRFVIDATGAVVASSNGGSDLPDARVVACVVRTFASLTFPAPNDQITVTYPVQFSPSDSVDTSVQSPPVVNNGAPPPTRLPVPPQRNAPEADEIYPERNSPYTGRFRAVMDTIAEQGGKAAIRVAFDWHEEAPGDVMALVALGEALEAAGEPESAARAYGSIIDLFPARADLRRFAGERLERLRGGVGLDLAVDTFDKAALERPDHPASHRLLAYARLKKGDPRRAFAAIATGLRQPYPAGRFAGVDRILREDLGIIAAAWIKKEPALRAEIMDRLNDEGGAIEDAPSLRFVLNWETDANDVDFHITDASGGHAYYRRPELPSGGALYADVTTGYGPECFTIRAPREQRSASYKLQAHYYARGPMGYGMGKLQIIDHDGKGGVSFEERPFVVMNDHAFVELGVVKQN